MSEPSASPLTAGIKALRDIALPLAIIMCAAAGLVVAYYNIPEVATALNRIGAVNAANPMAFAAMASGSRPRARASVAKGVWVSAMPVCIFGAFAKRSGRKTSGGSPVTRATSGTRAAGIPPARRQFPTTLGDA